MLGAGGPVSDEELLETAFALAARAGCTCLALGDTIEAEITVCETHGRRVRLLHRDGCPLPERIRRLGKAKLN